MRYHLWRCLIVNGLIKCKIKLLNLQYFDAPGHKFILASPTVSVHPVYAWGYRLHNKKLSFINESGESDRGKGSVIGGLVIQVGCLVIGGETSGV